MADHASGSAQPDRGQDRLFQMIQGLTDPHDTFERLVHERARLAILSSLSVEESMTFGELKGVLRATDGNLSVHARKLEEAGYVAVEKYFEGRVPKTQFRLTPRGRRALQKYLNHMEALIKAMRSS